MSSGRGPAPGKMTRHSRTPGPTSRRGGLATVSTAEAALALASASCTSLPCPQRVSLTEGAASPGAPRPPEGSTGVQGHRLPGAEALDAGLPAGAARSRQQDSFKVNAQHQPPPTPPRPRRPGRSRPRPPARHRLLPAAGSGGRHASSQADQSLASLSSGSAGPTEASTPHLPPALSTCHPRPSPRDPTPVSTTP